MKLPGDGFNWRRLTKRQIAIGLSLFAIIISSVAVTALVIRPAGAAPTQAQIKKEHDDPRDAGKYFQLRHYGTTLPAADAPAKAQAQARALPQYPTKRVSGGKIKSLAGTTTATWTAVGPAPEDYSTCTNPDFCTGPYGDDTGRITALAVDPTDSNNLWVGTANGGVWHSTDGGANYTAMSDTWQTLAIGSIAIDPNNHNTVYVGTGEANLNEDGYWGVGVYKTIDGGSNWTQLGFNKFGGMSIGKIAVDPNNSANILAAVDLNAGISAANTPPGGAASLTTNGGIWQSTDSGSTWTQVLEDNSSLKYDFGTEVLFDPANSGVAYAGLSNVFGLTGISGFTTQAGVYKSTDSGAHWTRLSNGIPTGASIERVSLGLSNNGATLYAALTDGTSANFGALLSGDVWVSTNANSAPASITFTAHAVPSDMAMGDSSGGFQYWYDIYAMVDPTNANTAYIGGIDIWQTTTGGTSWTNLTDAYGSALAGVHPDQHALAFFSSSSTSYYVGNDGGMWKNVSGTFTDLNDGGLNITQFYGGSYGDVGGALGTLYGGAQDNGELQFTGTTFSGPTTWNQAAGGDGGYTAVDYTDNHIVYAEFPDGLMYKSIDGGVNWGIVAPGGLELVNFIMPFIMSQSNHNTLFAGTDRVYATTNGASSWRALSGTLDTANAGHFGSEISALAVAPTNNAVVYAGDNAGKFFYTTNATASTPTWHSVTISSSTGGVLTSIAVDPGASGTVYATFANFASGAGHHVYKSTNNGANWTDISAGLPNVPFESVLLTGASQKVLIVGSDTGVFASPDQGTTWYTLGAGLPNVAIDQIFTSHDGGKLFVATHGRGMWELSTGALQVIPSTPISATVGVGSGGGTYSQTFTVKNSGSSSMNWSINDGAFPSCLSATPDSGTLAANGSTTVTVNVSTASAGTCADNVTVTADGLIPSVTIPVAVAAENLSKTWYFAEGYTASGFTTWLTLTNPGNVVAPVTITYLIQGTSTPVVKTVNVPANHRSTINVNNAVGAGKSVAMVVTSTQPIVAERPMYADTKVGSTEVYGGHSLLGATTLTQDFYLSYLDTTATHLTWLTALNRDSSQMTMTVTYYPKLGGTPIVKTHKVAAQSRGSFQVNNDVPAGTTYSAYVHLSVPGMLERPMYLKDAATGRVGVTDIPGVSAPQTAWYFAEGQSDSNHAESYILSNQTGSPAHAHIVFYGSDGSDPSFAYTIPVGGQVIVNVNSLVGVASQHGAAITSDDQPILAERYDSLKYIGPTGLNRATTTIPGTTDGSGTAALGQAFYFAEGFTGGTSNELLELANPASSQTATIYVSYIPSTGGAPTVIGYSVPAHSRLTIDVGAVLPGTSLSLQVLSDQPIAAERTLVFLFGITGGTRPGADVAAGYQP